MDLENLRQQTDALRIEIGKMVLGQDEIVELLLVSLYARGHVLLEGPPGTAKTLLAKSFSSALALEFGRIQFTPDLMPGDVLGASIFDFKSNSFILTKGPVFSQILLADEINRAPPKTQAALLQAMNERVVSIDGTDHELGREFMVIATQNPIEQQGTYPLPEAQLDRFLFKLILDFPPEDIEMAILQNHAGRPLNVGLSTDGIAKVMTSSDLMSIRDLIDKIILKDDILAYILRLVRATRESSEIAYGASTRAADALVGATRAIAAINGRDYAIPDDVKKLFIPAMRHRILLLPVAEIEGRSPEQALENIINQIEVPR